MPEGCVGYFPESVAYGPQDRPEGLVVLTLQCGGASGNGFLSVKQREAANEALKKKGEFKKGMFVYVDEQGKRHEKDGSEACFEHATGRELTFAKPRYEDLVMMDPSSYEWIPEGTPGVASKWLGTFTERNARFGFVRIDAGATFSAGMEPSIELAVREQGESVGRRRAVWASHGFRVPGKRRPDCAEGGRRDRIAPHDSAEVLIGATSGALAIAAIERRIKLN